MDHPVTGVQPVMGVQPVKDGLGRTGVVPPSAVPVRRMIVATGGTGNGMVNDLANETRDAVAQPIATEPIAMELRGAPGWDHPAVWDRTSGLALPVVRGLSVVLVRSPVLAGGQPDQVRVTAGVLLIAMVPSLSEREAAAVSPSGGGLLPCVHSVMSNRPQQRRLRLRMT